MSFGQRLRTLRNEQELSQGKLADQVGVCPQTICHIERDRGYPSLWTIERIAIALSVTLEELFRGVNVGAKG